MSGGVDSSVAAALLREAGEEVIGLHMRVYRQPAGSSFKRSCCSPVDVADAQAVARRLDIPFYVLDMEQAFEREVINPFIEAYRQGRTPIPCVLCNERLKLGSLLEKARLFDAAGVATGHYARVEQSDSGQWRLRRPRFRAKDQTYYLFSLDQERLAALRMPVGELTKEEVRATARSLDLPVADKPDSAEICFTAGASYQTFLEQRIDADDPALQPGPLVTTEGERIGTHGGVARYTVGQRRGLGVGAERPLYVTSLDAASNTVVVGFEEQTLAENLRASHATWHEPPDALAGRRLHAQIRARHEAAPCRLTPTGSNAFEVTFESPQRSIAPGQAAVIFDESNETVVAGGWIET